MLGIPLRRQLLLDGGACANFAKVLIECGANVNLQDVNNQMPLHLASKYGYLDTAQLLLDNGADPNAPDNNNMTPLHLASQRRHVMMFRQLHVRRNADGGSRARIPQKRNPARPMVSVEPPGYVLCRSRFQFR
jgi:ankyrin repeat protein